MTRAKALKILNETFDSYLIMEEVFSAAIGEFDDKQLIRYRLDEITDKKIALLTAIDALEQNTTVEAEPDKGWISVKDRLPKKDGKYVVWSDGELNICEYDVESQTFGDTFYDYDEMHSKLLCWNDDINKFVTHWMPLPEPPKGE